MSIIPALRKGRQENFEFEAKLGYIVSPCLKKKIDIIIVHISGAQCGDAIYMSSV
jgi:hypothetical protein